jgi:hypothetical protein
MAIDFPAAPALNDEYTYLGKTWKWDGDKWIPLSGVISAHSQLSGLTTGDPHTQYALSDGTRGSFASTGHSHSYDPAGTAAALVDDLSGVTNAAQARTNLGLGPVAQTYFGTSAGTTTQGNDSRLSDARTPTSHAASHAAAQSDALTLSINQITNLVTELSNKAPLTSPALTGTPTAPTATPGTNTTQIATTAYIASLASAGAPPVVSSTSSGAGSGSYYSKSDHSHGYSNTTIADLGSTQTFTGLKNFSAQATFTGTLAVSNSYLNITHSSNTAGININQYAGIGYGRTAVRWWVGKNSETESGSSIGSNLIFLSYDDAGAQLGSELTPPLMLKRATGTAVHNKLIDTAAWVLFGASGSGEYGKAGMPEGSISAVAGSRYQDSLITAGAGTWIKTSGSGNTGWKVLSGDTGWRNLGALANDWTGSVFIRRINDTVEMYFDAITPPATWVSDVFYNGGIAAGFQPDKPAAGGLVKIVDMWTKLSSSTTKMLLSTTPTVSSLTPESGTPDNTWGSFSGQISWVTSNTWPSSLPGTAA